MTIDIGNEAIWSLRALTSSIGIHGTTHIDRVNPANATGKVTQVEVYTQYALTNLVIATFQKVGTNSFSTRDSQSVGAISSSTEVITVEINDGGSGYTVDDILQINQTTKTPKAEIKVLTVNGSGAITGIEIVSGGVYHYIEDNIETLDGMGTGAKVNITAVSGKQTIETNIGVVIGDYIGFLIEDSGCMVVSYYNEIDPNDAYYAKLGDYIPCASQSFYKYSGYRIMIGGEITADEGGATTPDEEETPNPETWHHNGITTLNCFVAVGEQDSDQKTYAEIDGTLLVNQTGEFFGKTIDGELTVVRNVVGACLDTSQSLRMTITIDGEDVSDSIVGDIKIAHNLNYISTFSLSLGDSKYSPLTDSHIAINKEVVITVFINGQEIKMFTGLIDDTRTTHDGGYKLTIVGRDYGKKLLDKTMTLISVQESAQNAYRGSMVKYLASQADITNVNVPTGDAVTIDHSFQDQTIWDMIQKECAIEGWYVRHDENAVMQLKTRELKTTADWEYGEDKFVQLGLETSDRGIVNKVIILGAIFEEEVITINDLEVPPYEPVYDEQTTTFNKSFSAGEVVDGWSDEDANFKVTAKYLGSTIQPGLPFNPFQDYRFTITRLNNDLTIADVTYTITGYASTYRERFQYCEIHREMLGIPGGAFSFREGAFAITIIIKTKELVAGGSEWITENIPNETTVSTITYTQVKATVQDNNSIALYGERKPNNEGTLPFPLAETTAQCKRIGENIILDSHRFIKQPDFLVNFNPKLIVGETVELTDKKIGYDGDRYFVEEVIHTISINKKTGAVKPRTRIGCVYYA